MSRRATTVSVIASLGIVIAGWRLGSSAVTGNTVAGAAAVQQAAPGVQSSGTGGTGGTGGATGAGLRDGTYTGAAANNPYGSWTVSVVVSGGRISDSSATTTASDSRSRRIATFALPTLRNEVLTAQNAKVQAVSGATYTSRSYLSSLQSALDKAAA